MNSEQQTASYPDLQDQALVTVGDPSLTLAAKKLAGSAGLLPSLLYGSHFIYWFPYALSISRAGS